MEDPRTWIGEILTSPMCTLASTSVVGLTPADCGSRRIAESNHFLLDCTEIIGPACSSRLRDCPTQRSCPHRRSPCSPRYYGVGCWSHTFWVLPMPSLHQYCTHHHRDLHVPPPSRCQQSAVGQVRRGLVAEVEEVVEVAEAEMVHGHVAGMPLITFNGQEVPPLEPPQGIMSM